jgi:hypothetical protein
MVEDGTGSNITPVLTGFAENRVIVIEYKHVYNTCEISGSHGGEYEVLESSGMYCRVVK